MDYVDRFSGRGSFAEQLNPATLFKFSDLTVPVQQHLQRVYITLAGALLAAAAGVYTNLVSGIGGWLAIVGFIGSTFWLASTPANPASLNKRYGLLGGAAFSQGLTVGPLVGAALHVNSGILVTAFLATAAVFACFSAAAVVSRRRSWLYLGGLLSSAISIMTVMRLGAWLFSSRSGAGNGFVYAAELYGGLVVFLGYILFDTQMIIEKASAGDMDPVKHALDLFVDFAAVFVRLLVILLQKEGQKEDERRRSKKRS